MAVGYRSSSSTEQPAWLRLAVPSVADAFFLAVLGAVVFTPLAVRLLGDAGVGWHIRTGQLILQTHAIPRLDPFSSTMAGKPWFAWEWLYDLGVGELDARLGLNGVAWFSGVVIAAIFAGTLHWLIRRGVNLLAALTLVLLALGASMIHLLARPHLLSWLFVVIWFVILDFCERNCLSRRGRIWLWILPLLMLVWANVHGGFLIGFVLLITFWLAAAWNWFRSNGDRIEESLQKIAARHLVFDLTWVGLLSAAASLVNPYGWKLHAHIYSYLSDRFLMDHIQEFQSPDFHGVAEKCFALLVLITLGTLAWRRRTAPRSGVLLMLFSVYTGLYSSRNLPVSSLLLVMVVGPLFSLSPERGFFQRMAALQSGLRRHIWPAAAILLTLVITTKGGHAGSGRWMDAHFDSKRMPVAAVDYLEKRGVKAPVLTPDAWGGYLIYRRYPLEQVVVDDRHDLYGRQFFKSYLKMVRAEQGWQDFLQERAVQSVLFPRDAALTSLLMESANWKAVYRDDVAVIFERGGSR